MTDSGGFKRVRLTGSDELFRETKAGPPAGPDAGAADVAPSTPPVRVDLTADELRSIVAALQLARFPERTRPRPTITEFEHLGALQERLRELLTES